MSSPASTRSLTHVYTHKHASVGSCTGMQAWASDLEIASDVIKEMERAALSVFTTLRWWHQRNRPLCMLSRLREALYFPIGEGNGRSISKYITDCNVAEHVVEADHSRKHWLHVSTEKTHQWLLVLKQSWLWGNNARLPGSCSALTGNLFLLKRTSL